MGKETGIKAVRTKRVRLSADAVKVMDSILSDGSVVQIKKGEHGDLIIYDISKGRMVFTQQPL